jgi:hypothetical protein
MIIVVIGLSSQVSLVTVYAISKRLANGKRVNVYRPVAVKGYAGAFT